MNDSGPEQSEASSEARSDLADPVIEQQIESIAEGFLEALRAGEAPDKARIVAANPELAAWLEPRLALVEGLFRIAGRQAETAVRHEPDGAAPERSEGRTAGVVRTGRRAIPLICPHCGHRVQLVEIEASQATCGNCGSAFRVEVPLEARRPGSLPRRIGRFEVHELLGQGAFGAVYRARDPALGRIVAIKTPRAGYFGSNEQQERFLREARSAARLNHPSIVQVHEIAVEDGVPFIVSEYIDGVTLADRLRGGRPTFRESAELVARIAEALDYAHRQRVFHRDIKPANVLIDHDGRPHVTDFGLARHDEGEITVTVEGQILGTPAYMSPEQAAGHASLVDGRSDVYSLGVMLYEMLTGELPFRGAPRMLLDQVMHDEPRPPRRLIDKIPRDLETICLKALSKSPARRYTSAAAMADDLRRFLGGEPIQARPVGRLERFWRWCRRNPVVAGLLAAVAVSLVLGTTVSIYYALRARQGEYDAQTSATLAREREQIANWHSYVASMNVAAEDVKRGEVDRARDVLRNVLPRAGQPDLRGFEWYHLWKLGHAESDGLDLYAQHGQSSSIEYVEFLAAVADGKSWAIGGAYSTYSGKETGQNGRLILWDPTGQKQRTLVDTSHGAFALSPDGRIVAAARPAEGSAAGEEDLVTLRDAATGKVLARVGGPVQPLAWNNSLNLAFAADGRTLACGGQDGSMRNGTYPPFALLIDVPTRQVRPKLDGGGNVAFSPDGSLLATGAVFDEVKVWETASGRQRSRIPVWPNALAFAPDGQTLATVDGSHKVPGEIGLWDAASGRRRMVAFRDAHAKGISAVAFSPDGMMLATGGFDATVKLWDVPTGRELARFIGHAGQVRGLAFARDGRTLASGAYDGVVKLWDISAVLYGAPIRGNHHGALSVAFSPDGKVLATGGWDTQWPASPGIVKLWDAATGAELRVIRDLNQKVLALAFSPDGSTLVTGGGDLQRYDAPGEVKLWDVASGRARLLLGGLGGAVTGLAFSPDGKTLATASRQAVLWDASTGKQRLVLQGPTSWVHAVAFAPDGKILGTSGASGEVKLWEPATGKPLGAFEGHREVVNHLAFSPDGKTLATASWDKTASLWDVATREERAMLEGHDQLVDSVVFSPDGKTLATGGRDRTARLWDVATGRELAQFPLPGGWNEINSVCFAPDGRRLAAAGAGNAIRIWDITTGRTLAAPSRGHSWGITALEFSPEGAWFATAGYDGTIKLWDTASGDEMATLIGHSGSVEAVAFSPDGALLASGGSDQTIRLWDVATRTEVALLKGQAKRVESVRFSPDGRAVATVSTGNGANDAELILWDPVARKQRASFVGYRSAFFARDGSILATHRRVGEPNPEAVILLDPSTGLERAHFPGIAPAGFSPDGRALAVFDGEPDTTSSLPAMVSLWDWAERRKLVTLKGHAKTITSVAFSSDGRTIATGSEDQTIKLWDLATGRERFTLTGPTDRVQCVAFAPDGKTLIAGCMRFQMAGSHVRPSEVFVWRAAREEEIAAHDVAWAAREQSAERNREEFQKYITAYRASQATPLKSLPPIVSSNSNELIRRYRAELSFSSSLAASSMGSSPVQAFDGDPTTSWQSGWHDSVAKGGHPWFQVNFPRDVTVRRVTILGPRDRETAILAGALELLDRRGVVIAARRGESKTWPYDFEFRLEPPIEGVQRIRWTSERDQGAENPMGIVSVAEVLVE